ncbi:MAG TPA: hypothetical protein ENN06_11420 [Desulfobacteraceae bacterium]|nr:hypothetical protein [Desulfobacteraceae bacterium]
MKHRSEHCVLWFGYAVVCLVYGVWIVYLGLDNFSMVHDGYHQAGAQLHPEQVGKAALRELVEECREEAAAPGHPGPDGESYEFLDDPCLLQPAAAVEERQKIVKKRLLGEQGRAWRKLMLFYLSFGIVFLVLPMLTLYLALAFFLWLWRNLRIIR